MSEFELQINQGSITVNLDDLKAELKEISDKYKGIVIKENDISLAKKDLARLRKIRKSVDDRRKEVKAEWNKPYVKFEDEVKNALAIIDAPINEIDSILKDFDTQQKANKEQICRELFENNIGEYKDFVEFGDVFRDTWLNKSTSENEIISDISGARVKVTSDLEAIKALNSEFESEVIDYYKKTKSLSDAIQRNSQLISAKQVAEQKVTEEKKAEPIVTPVEVKPAEYHAIFTVRCKDESSAEELEAFLRLNDITDYSIVH